MNRTLNAVTIIPPELYVERAADRQLRDILEGMGRPGYVLVARQMGKTNLLLNARRSLERSDFLFVYVDLSIKLESLEHYFAVLLNTAFAVHPEICKDVKIPELIREQYSTATFEATLRAVLKAYPGKIVFVLDEIDSLANYSFSDRVFSQIRSMYFSRANFPEYGRVTYVLSGVAEPSELIKDKNVSPFNIGQKIFLNDFSESEFHLFLRKAGLSLNSDTVDRIYYWAGGNPRLTWDICAEIEDVTAKKGLASVEDVDRIVSSLYLTSYDRAPVDHIRTLAQTDREIRAAIKHLRSGQVSEISDKVRNKLYLAGVTSLLSEGAGNTVLKIKNQIIDAVLSDRWLRDVEKQSRNILQLARENSEEKLYEPAVAFFEEYLIDNSIDPGSVDAYRLANAYFSTRRFEKAIDWLKRYAERSESNEIQADVSFLIGRSHLVLGNFGEAADAFRKVIEIGVRSLLPTAKGLLASSLIQLDVHANAAEIRDLCESALQLADAAPKEEQAANARVVALLSMSALEEVAGRKSKSLELIERAEKENASAYRPIIILNSLKLVGEGKRKNRLLDELADSVISVASAPQEQRMDALPDPMMLSALIALRLNNRREDFDRLLQFYLTQKDGSLSEPAAFVALYETAAKTSGNDATTFLKDLVEKFRDHAPALETVLDAARTLVIVERSETFGRQYISALAASNPSQREITDADHVAIAVVLISALRNDNVDALSMIDGLPQPLTLEKAAPTFGELYHASFEISRLERLGRVTAAVELGLRLIEHLKGKSSAVQIFSEENRRAMIGAAQTTIDRYSKAAIDREVARYGRNTKVTVVYSDGRRLTTKFKLVQRDVALGKCTVALDENS